MNSNQQKQFSIFQWNMLAQIYADSSSFPNCDSSYLNLEYRKQLILVELNQMKSDLYCIEECDQPQIFKDSLQPQNYEVIWEKKKEGSDGILFAYNKNKFKLKNIQRFDYIVNQEQSNQFMLKVELLCDKISITIICTHLKAKEQFQDVRVSQVQQILQQITDQNIILCGDFNDEPNSLPIKQIYLEKVNFQSDFTTFKIRDKTYKRTIDYIFYKGFKLKSTNKLKTVKEIGEKGLPNKDFPSDHLYLFAVFSLDLK